MSRKDHFMTFEDYRISLTISNHTDLVFYSSFRCWYFRQCLLMFLASQMTQQVNFWHNLRKVLTRLSIHKGTKWNCLKLYVALLLCKGNAFSTLRPGIEKVIYIQLCDSPQRYTKSTSFSCRMAWQQGSHLGWNGVTHQQPIGASRSDEMKHW